MTRAFAHDSTGNASVAVKLAAAVSAGAVMVAAANAADMTLTTPAAATNSLPALKPYQRRSSGTPPKSPEEFNPDFGITPEPTRRFEEENLQLKPGTRRSAAPPPAPAFNPDPGAWQKTAPVPAALPLDPLRPEPAANTEPLPPELSLPRDSVRRPILEAVPVEPPPSRGAPAPRFGEPVPADLRLPRENPRWNEKIPTDWHSSNQYPLAGRGEGYPPYAIPVPNRWRVPFAHWDRYPAAMGGENPYQDEKLHLWHPYKQSLLKGDAPILGQDIFLNMTASSETLFEVRRLPTPSGVSAARAEGAEFYGRSEQLALQQYGAFSVELFQGEAAFKPVHWAIKLQPVFNLNYVYARETGVIAPDPRGIDLGPNPPPPNPGAINNPGDVAGALGSGFASASGDDAGRKHTTRTKDYFALQEWFAEAHLGDLSDNYDFIAAKAGNQYFNSDFRGFVFNDVNLGGRVFGNIDNNRYQFNAAAFDMREKDTYSDLNSFDQRNQRVFIANLYRQDFLAQGYTAQLSFHANLDQGGTHYDRTGGIARPAPLGGPVAEHDVNAYYLGWAGDGHIGRWNLSHAFYQVLGRDDLNGLAGRAADIDAQMAAIELSYDQDWIRYKASAFYASGDSNAEDGHANGFDTILDNPNFTGGPFSYYVHQGFNLGGTAVALKQRNSLVPNLRTSKTEGQASFVNPGVFLAGLGTDIDLTPKLKTFVNANYVRMMETDPVKTALLTDKVDNELGWDFSLGFQYRPLLTDNIILSAGFGAFLPGKGFKDVYKTSTDPIAGFDAAGQPGRVDDFLYSGLFVITLTY